MPSASLTSLFGSSYTPEDHLDGILLKERQRGELTRRDGQGGEGGATHVELQLHLGELLEVYLVLRHVAVVGVSKRKQLVSSSTSFVSPREMPVLAFWGAPGDESVRCAAYSLSTTRVTTPQMCIALDVEKWGALDDEACSQMGLVGQSRKREPCVVFGEHAFRSRRSRACF